MFKKIFIIGGGLMLVSFLLFGKAAFSHVEHGVSWLQDQAQDSIPVEYEIDRARDLIEKSEPQIRQCKSLIAEKEVRIRRLKGEIAANETKIENDREALARAAEILQDPSRTTFKVSHITMDRDRYAKRARLGLDRIKAADAMLASKKERLQALEHGLVSARTTLDRIYVQRESLIAKVETLEAKLQEVKAKATLSESVDIDDSHLADARKLLSDIDLDLDIAIQKMANDEPLLDDMTLDVYEDTDISSDITAYLTGDLEIDEMPLDSETMTASHLVPVEAR